MRAIRDVTNFSYFVSAELAHLILADAELRPLQAGDLGDLERAVLCQFERGDDADEVAASLGLAGDAFTGVLASIWTGPSPGGRDSGHRRVNASSCLWWPGLHP